MAALVGGNLIPANIPLSDSCTVAQTNSGQRSCSRLFRDVFTRARRSGSSFKRIGRNLFKPRNGSRTLRTGRFKLLVIEVHARLTSVPYAGSTPRHDR